jgi:enoyl-CoA hydratase
MQNFETIELAQSDAVGWITFNRPDALNALSLTVLEEVAKALDILIADGIRVIVFTGRGRAFSAGADLKGLGDSKDGPAHFLQTIKALFGRIRSLPIPVIAAINGIASGGGLELALCADIVVAAEGARIADGHANFGVIPGAGSSVLLPRAIGPAKAKYMLFTGDALSAVDLERAGLIAKVFPDDQLMEGTRKIAERIAEKSPLGLGIMKRLINESQDRSVEDALQMEIEANASYAQSHDIKEGMMAFKERRKPKFLGR